MPVCAALRRVVASSSRSDCRVWLRLAGEYNAHAAVESISVHGDTDGRRANVSPVHSAPRPLPDNFHETITPA